MNRIDPCRVVKQSAHLASIPFVAIYSIAFEIFLVAKVCLQELFDYTTIETLKQRIYHRFPQETDLHNAIERIGAVKNKRLLNSFLQENECGRIILRDLLNNFFITDRDLIHILCGGQGLLDDNGETADNWNVNLERKRNRLSSHRSDGDQHAVITKIFSEFLWMKVTHDGKTYTKFQAERRPADHGYYIRHLYDFFFYWATGLNQGPWGQSRYTESRPMILHRDQMRTSIFTQIPCLQD